MPSRYLLNEYLLFRSIHRNTGVPQSAVTTPTGSSCGENIMRAKRSAQTIKIAPNKMEKLISLLWAAPTMLLAICGMTKPTNPIAPLMETRTAVSKVLTRMRIHLIRTVFTPVFLAISSPTSNASSSRLRGRTSIMPTVRTTTAIGTSDQSVPAKDPVSQNVALCTLLESGVRKITILVSAEKNDDSAIPTRIILVVLIFPFFNPKTKTMTAVSKAPKKELSARGTFPIRGSGPIKRERTAPAEAPEETPRTYGSARGFLVIACISIPVSTSPAPVHAATITFGSRKAQIILI